MKTQNLIRGVEIMFTKEKGFDEKRIQELVSLKKVKSFEKMKESLTKDFLIRKSDVFYETVEMDKANILDMYLTSFRDSLIGFSLDELEYIQTNHLFDFNKQNLVDYRCQKILDEIIENFKKTIEDLNEYIETERIESYFQKFGDLHNQVQQAMKIEMILGLDRQDVVLTLLGRKLKSYIRKILNNYIDFLQAKGDLKLQRI